MSYVQGDALTWVTKPKAKRLWVPARNSDDTSPSFQNLYLFKINLQTFSLEATKDFGFQTSGPIAYEGMFAAVDATDVYVADVNLPTGSARVSKVNKSDLSTVWSQDTGTVSEPLGIIEIGDFVYVVYIDNCQVDKVRKSDGAVVDSLTLEAGHTAYSQLYSPDGTKIYVYSNVGAGGPGPWLHRIDVSTFTEDVAAISFQVGDRLDEIFGFFTHKGDTLHFAGDVWFASAYAKKVDIPTFTMGVRGGPYPPAMFSHSGSAYYSPDEDKVYIFEHGLGVNEHHIHRVDESTYAWEASSANLFPTLDPLGGLAAWGMVRFCNDQNYLYCQAMGNIALAEVVVLRLNPNTLAFDPVADRFSIQKYMAGLGCYG